MKAIEILSLAKCVSDTSLAEARERVKPGIFQISFDVTLSGSVRIGNDYSMKCAQKARPWLLATIALGKLPQSVRDSVISEYILAMKKEELDELEKETKKTAEEKVNEVIEKTEVPCKGRITPLLSYNAIKKGD